MRWTRRRFALMAAPALGGCTAVQFANREPPKLFELTPKSTFEPGLPVTNALVIVEPATANAGLNTARIALRPEPTLLDYYANATWIEVVPVMVQTLAIESLDNSGSVDALFPAEAAGIRPGFQLRLNIREFQAVYDNGTNSPPDIQIRLQARLLELPRRNALGQFDEKAMQRSETTAIEDIVLAFDTALGRVLKQLSHWVAELTADAIG